MVKQEDFQEVTGKVIEIKESHVTPNGKNSPTRLLINSTAGNMELKAFQADRVPSTLEAGDVVRASYETQVSGNYPPSHIIQTLVEIVTKRPKGEPKPAPLPASGGYQVAYRQTQPAVEDERASIEAQSRNRLAFQYVELAVGTLKDAGVPLQTPQGSFNEYGKSLGDVVRILIRTGIQAGRQVQGQEVLNSDERP